MGLEDVQEQNDDEDRNKTGEPVPAGHVGMLRLDKEGILLEVEALLAALVDVTLQPDQAGDADDNAGDDGQDGGSGGLGAVELHRNEVLDLGGAGDSGHRDAESAGGDGAGELGAGDISGTVDGVAHGVDNEDDDEEGDAAVGHQHAGQNDSQHGIFRADPVNQLLAEGTGSAGLVHNLAVDSAEEERGEPGLEVAGGAFHVGVGVRIKQVQTTAEGDERSAERRNPDDGVSLERKEHQKCEADKNSYYAH